jgi:hypothetical protein
MKETSKDAILNSPANCIVYFQQQFEISISTTLFVSFLLWFWAEPRTSPTLPASSPMAHPHQRFGGLLRIAFFYFYFLFFIIFLIIMKV